LLTPDILLNFFNVIRFARQLRNFNTKSVHFFSCEPLPVSQLNETRFPDGIFNFNWNRTKTTFNANASAAFAARGKTATTS